MGRRALPKLDQTLAVSRHLLDFAALASPLDRAGLFGRTAPLEVEVGSGKGLFLSRAARERPVHDFLGCEVAFRYAHYAAAQLSRVGATNALVVHGDALRLFAELLPNASVAAVHIYFPDPWWKRRHHKRRLMQQPFLQQVERVLEPGAELHFWTDVPEYFQAACADFASATNLRGPFDVPEPSVEDDWDYRTHFERRIRMDAMPVHRALYCKPGL